MLIPEGFAQANFIFNGADLPLGGQITMGFILDPGGPSPSALATELGAAWGATMRPLQTTTVGLDSVLVKFGPNATGPSALVATPFAGTATGAADSPNIAWLVHKNTAFGGRSGRGRFYVPGTPASALTGAGQVVGASFTITQTAITAFYNRLITDGNIPVVLHAEGAPITEPTVISSFTLDGTAATQRRRLRR